MSIAKKSTKKKRESHFFYDFVKITAAFPTWVWFRPKGLYINETAKKRIKGGALVAANHNTFLDPITLLCVVWYRRLYSLATKDLVCTPIREKMFKLMHCIIIDKENASIGAVRAVCDVLKADKAVMIFPEGTVNVKDEEVKSYKSGVILMAHLSEKPIIPIYLVKPEHWYSRRYFVVGEPFDVAAMCGKIPTMQEMQAASEHLHAKEVELKEFYERYKKQRRKQ